MARVRFREPLTNRQLEELLDHVEERLDDEWCDQTLRYAREFLVGRGLNVLRTTAWLEKWGCYCDCEILMNLDCRWKEPD